MNSTFISGKFKWKNRVSSENQIDHLEGILGTRHKTKSGEVKFDNFRFSVWGNTARRFHDEIKIGQIVALKGYLTTGKTNTGATYTEICVEEYIPFIQTTAKSNTRIESATAKLSTDVDGDTVTDPQDSVEAMVSDELKASIARMASAQIEADQVNAIPTDDSDADVVATHPAIPMDPAVDDQNIIAQPDDEDTQVAGIVASVGVQTDDIQPNTEAIMIDQITE